ncbi:TPA: hypothetical protein ACKP22_000922 [Pseudomonas putida]
MSVDILKLKTLATAAKRDQYDNVALNDYGMAMAPAVTLELIAEIERHRQVNAEGCKPDSSIPFPGLPSTGAASCRSLDEVEGCKPDLNISPAQTTVSAADREIKKAEDELIFAQVGLLSVVRRAYPVGSRLQVQIGRSATEVVVKGHISAWWSRPGYIQATNPRTGKTRTFPHSAVIGVVKEVLP